MKRFGMSVVIGVVFATAAGAQQAKVPAELVPPKGMCRILIDGVPNNQQPAPTDCRTAVKNRPSNGRVIFGDDYAKKDEPKTPAKPTNYGPPPPTPPGGAPPVQSRPRVKPPQ
jgi:hypothetical protein